MSNMFSLRDKTIVITGGAGLLGRMHADAILKFDGEPILLDKDNESLEEAKKYLFDIHKKEIMTYVTDITNEDEVKEVSEDININFKNFHGLINNAANNPKVGEDSTSSGLEDFPLDLWQKDIDVGLTGSLICTKFFGTLLANKNSGGSILNISSDLGLIGPDQRIYEKDFVKPISYSVVKSGIIGLTKYTATYWADKNIRCNAICPGGIDNNQSKDFLKKIERLIPLGRLAKAEEYQGVSVWILSDASSYLTGSIISIDGGRTAW